jgi:DNA-binding phage protein
MLKDYRESFAAELRDPEFPREYIAAAYEEEGADGVIRALREISPAADGARHSRFRSLTEGGDMSLNAVQTALQTLGLRRASRVRF